VVHPSHREIFLVTRLGKSSHYPIEPTYCLDRVLVGHKTMVSLEFFDYCLLKHWLVVVEEGEMLVVIVLDVSIPMEG
jgi:hypothetical protein